MIKPILFNEQMVRAILDGRKTNTRRIVRDLSIFGVLRDPETKFITINKENGFYPVGAHFKNAGISYLVTMPYSVGDILWVRETWQQATDVDANEDFIEGTERYLYAASDTPIFNTWINADGSTRDHMPWRPSIHMPKSAARLFLKVTGVRVERLQEITEEGAIKEGVEALHETIGDGKLQDVESIDISARSFFFDIWNSTIPKKRLAICGYDANPYVWVYEFERCEKPEEWEV